jgi:peptidoglycan/xylan/chitin deacetylase (PgdA/CDA1 family)
MKVGLGPGLFAFALGLVLIGTEATSVNAQVITSGPVTCPGVALTFDLCPVRDGSGYDEELIRYLIEQRIPATFFMSGRWIARHDRQVKALLEVPFFELGTHGDAHLHLPMHLPAEQEQEILAPVRILKSKYGHEARLFRPPYGEFNDDTVKVAQAAGLQFILWNVVSGDPDPTLSAEHIESRLSRLTRKGSIIVMHANGKGKYTRHVVAHLSEQLLPRRGLKAMTVSDMLACGQDHP